MRITERQLKRVIRQIIKESIEAGLDVDKGMNLQQHMANYDSESGSVAGDPFGQEGLDNFLMRIESEIRMRKEDSERKEFNNLSLDDLVKLHTHVRRNLGL